MKFVINLALAFALVLMGFLIGTRFCGTKGGAYEVRWVEVPPTGPPPTSFEVYIDEQHYWHIIVDGHRVCSCRGGF